MFILTYVPKLGTNIQFFMYLLRYIIIYTYVKVGYAYLIYMYITFTYLFYTYLALHINYIT
jgi:hypothetical protein